MSDETIIVNKRKSAPKRLGMGLSALLGGIDDVDIFNTSLGIQEEESANPSHDATKLKGFSIIPIHFIIPNAKQPRKVFAETELYELSNSIKENGILQPILVRKLEENLFEIVAGERRYRASKLANLTEMPCIIRDFSDEQVFILAVIENIQREDLNPLEEAESYIRLIKEFKYTQEQVAQLVHKSRSHIANLTRLTNLPSEIKALVLSGELTGGHVRPLLALKTEEQMKNVADVILQNNYSVRKVEELVNLILNDEEKLENLEQNLKELGNRIYAKKNPSQESSFLIDEISKAFHQKFEIPIKIKHSKRGGLISIKYKTEAELEKIMKNFIKNQEDAKIITLPLEGELLTFNL